MFDSFPVSQHVKEEHMVGSVQTHVASTVLDLTMNVIRKMDHVTRAVSRAFKDHYVTKVRAMSTWRGKFQFRFIRINVFGKVIL